MIFGAILPSFEKYVPKFSTRPCFVYKSDDQSCTLKKHMCALRKNEKVFISIKRTYWDEELDSKVMLWKQISCVLVFVTK